MIQIKEFPNKTFLNKGELFSALRDNKNDLIAQKKMLTKESDSVVYSSIIKNDKDSIDKSSIDITDDINSIRVKVVINTTGIMDSHSDVHIKGIWNKSVKEVKNVYLLQEHQMTFDHIVSDDVKASLENISWEELGQKYDGETQALVFSALISKERNPFMFNQYAKGYVKEHSVGMRYIKYDLAMNSESKYDEDEKELWDKYIDTIVNKEEAESQGYFWVVKEAKIIEGSAVVKGSNHVTPPISIEAVKQDTSKQEPSNDTQLIDHIRSKNYFNN